MKNWELNNLDSCFWGVFALLITHLLANGSVYLTLIFKQIASQIPVPFPVVADCSPPHASYTSVKLSLIVGRLLHTKRAIVKGTNVF